jgi:hypothetical protein
MVEEWTVSQVADYLGINQNSARTALSRLGIRALRYRRNPSPAGGGSLALYSAQTVRARAAVRPGRGNRINH